MPNWTTNNLQVKKKDYKKFLEAAVRKVGDEDIDFGVLIEAPVCVIADRYYNSFVTNTPEAPDFNIKEDMDKYKEIDDNFFFDERGERIRLYQVFKSKNDLQGWYDWQCNKWGTKWGACETCLPDADDIAKADDEDYLDITFDTAWSAPMPWYEELAKVVPFCAECIEEGGFFHLNLDSDGQGNLTVDDDTEEYFANLDEDE